MSPIIPSLLPEKFCCPHCPKIYYDEESLKDHINANHWKKLYPRKKGKPQ